VLALNRTEIFAKIRFRFQINLGSNIAPRHGGTRPALEDLRIDVFEPS
jgi:hypothetical protein